MNEEEILRMCEDMFKNLNKLFKEVGSYAVSSSWQYDKKIRFQCDHKKLEKWLKENDLNFNSTERNCLAYETDKIIFYSDLRY